MISRHDVLAFIEYEKYFRSCGNAERQGSHDGEAEAGFADLPAPEQAMIILAALSRMQRR